MGTHESPASLITDELPRNRAPHGYVACRSARMQEHRQSRDSRGEHSGARTNSHTYIHTHVNIGRADHHGARRQRAPQVASQDHGAHGRGPRQRVHPTTHPHPRPSTHTRAHTHTHTHTHMHVAGADDDGARRHGTPQVAAQDHGAHGCGLHQRVPQPQQHPRLPWRLQLPRSSEGQRYVNYLQ